jgi:hypothetical protein
MIKVILGNPDYISDNVIMIDQKMVDEIEIPMVSSTIWAFSFNETTKKGEIEFQNNQQNNNQFVNGLKELESVIGCTLQSIKDLQTKELERLEAESNE